MTYVTVQLKDAPELYLCHGYDTFNQYEFGDPSVSKVVHFESHDTATRTLSIHYPGVPTELFLFSTYEQYNYELVYILPKLVNDKVVGHVKYILQNDGQLAPHEQSMNSRKFKSYHEVSKYITEHGTLSVRYYVQPTTQDF